MDTFRLHGKRQIDIVAGIHAQVSFRAQAADSVGLLVSSPPLCLDHLLRGVVKGAGGLIQEEEGGLAHGSAEISPGLS